MRAALAELVPLKLEPKKHEAHKEVAETYHLRGYPTIVFADAQGEELDRILGFRSATDFLAEIERSPRPWPKARLMAARDWHSGLWPWSTIASTGKPHGYSWTHRRRSWTSPRRDRLRR